MASDETTQQLRQAEYLRRYFEDTGREYATGKNVKCPNAQAHAHGDANASAKIYENADGAIVKCFGCGGRWDIFGLWQMDNGGTFAEAKAALCERYGVGRATGGTGSHGAHGRAERQTDGEDAPQATHVTATPQAARQRKPDAQTKAYIDRCAIAYQAGEDAAGRDYMRRRGISDETVRRFNIGYDAKRQAVIIPQGAGYMARSILPDVEQKDKCRYYPKGAPRVLFNGAAIIQAAKDGTPVFIVEGEIDALSVAECGGVAVSTGGTAGIGKAVKAAQTVGRGVYVPFMDRDKAGEDAQAKLTAKLREIGGAVYVYADAPLALLPDGADGTRPKDANEALQQGAAAFRARVEDVIAKAKAYAEAEEEKHRPYFTLDELEEPPEEAANPRAIFKRGYLRKGGGLIVASVAGAGKSTFSLQCALHWVLGEPCFGIAPVRPLRVAVIQAEDDLEELAMFRASMRKGMVAEGFTTERIDEALRRLHIRTDFLGKTGVEFAEALRKMQSKDKYDLVIVNPLNSYFDGDISLNKDATEFFRTMVDPIIKNQKTECAIVFIHHMGKPAKGKDAVNWGKGAYAQYAMQGAAELNNWARAVLIIVPFDNAPDFWTITAAKRHKPLSWKDADGRDTKDKVIAYSSDYVYWREPGADEIAAAKNGTKPTKETEEERKQREELELRQAIAEIVTYLQNLPQWINRNKLFAWCDKNESAIFKGFRSHTVKKPNGEYNPKRPCYLAYELVTSNPGHFGVGYHVGKYKNGHPYELYGGVADASAGQRAAGAAMPSDAAQRDEQAEDEKSIDDIIAEQDALGD